MTATLNDFVGWKKDDLGKELAKVVGDLRDLSNLCDDIITKILNGQEEPRGYFASTLDPENVSWRDVQWWAKHSQGLSHMGKDIERALTQALVMHELLRNLQELEQS